MAVPSKSEFAHIPGGSDHYECPEGYVFFTGMTDSEIAAFNWKPYNVPMVSHNSYCYDRATKQRIPGLKPIFITKDDWLRLHVEWNIRGVTTGRIKCDKPNYKCADCKDTGVVMLLTSSVVCVCKGGK